MLGMRGFGSPVGPRNCVTPVSRAGRRVHIGDEFLAGLIVGL